MLLFVICFTCWGDYDCFGLECLLLGEWVVIFSVARSLVCFACRFSLLYYYFEIVLIVDWYLVYWVWWFSLVVVGVLIWVELSVMFTYEFGFYVCLLLW